MTRELKVFAVVCSSGEIHGTARLPPIFRAVCQREKSAGDLVVVLDYEKLPCSPHVVVELRGEVPVRD